MDATESYIRSAAAQRGIDPDQAMRVAKSEGFNSYTGDNGSSFGPFQLHYGNVAPGGNAVSGMGDDFTKQTGLDARNPNTVPQQIDFALDHAAQSGWGPWHGWKGSPFAGINGAPTGQTSMPDQPTVMAQAQQPQVPTLFGGNPTPVGGLASIARMLGIGSEPGLGSTLKNISAAAAIPGNFGKSGAEGAAALEAAANQPHFDVVSDALGNRYIIDKRTGAISQPGANGAPAGVAQPGLPQPGALPQAAQQQQQFKPSGDPALDAVGNSPIGALKSGDEQITQGLKDKQDLNDAAGTARQLQDLAERQLRIAQSGKIVQGPAWANTIREEAAKASGGAIGGVDLDLQNQFDLNNQAMSTLMGKDILNNARVAGPELRFLSLTHPNSEYTQGANVGALNDIISRAQRMQNHANIGAQYKFLGPNYQKEIQAHDKANPLYSNHGNDTAGPGETPGFKIIGVRDK